MIKKTISFYVHRLVVITGSCSQNLSGSGITALCCSFPTHALSFQPYSKKKASGERRTEQLERTSLSCFQLIAQGVQKGSTDTRKTISPLSYSSRHSHQRMVSPVVQAWSILWSSHPGRSSYVFLKCCIWHLYWEERKETLLKQRRGRLSLAFWQQQQLSSCQHSYRLSPWSWSAQRRFLEGNHCSPLPPHHSFSMKHGRDKRMAQNTAAKAIIILKTEGGRHESNAFITLGGKASNWTKN